VSAPRPRHTVTKAEGWFTGVMWLAALAGVVWIAAL